jgi:nicotinamidase-related amidase
MRSNPPSLLDRNTSALLVIDVQERLLPYIHEGDAVVRNVVKLIRFSRIVGMPILWAEQEKLGLTAAPIREALAGIEPVQKVEFGAVACQTFRDKIGDLGAKSLILAGIEAHICVAQTALQALPTHEVHVVADAVGSRAPENRVIALERLRQAGAVITSTEMVLYEILWKAGTDEFRQVLPLVK